MTGSPLTAGGVNQYNTGGSALGVGRGTEPALQDPRNQHDGQHQNEDDQEVYERVALAHGSVEQGIGAVSEHVDRRRRPEHRRQKKVTEAHPADPGPVIHGSEWKARDDPDDQKRFEAGVIDLLCNEFPDPAETMQQPLPEKPPREERSGRTDDAADESPRAAQLPAPDEARGEHENARRHREDAGQRKDDDERDRPVPETAELPDEPTNLLAIQVIPDRREIDRSEERRAGTEGRGQRSPAA